VKAKGNTTLIGRKLYRKATIYNSLRQIIVCFVSLTSRNVLYTLLRVHLTYKAPDSPRQLSTY